jgi:ABC-2 type transport system permease protein
MMRPARAIRAEWTKLRTLPSTGWLMLLAIAGTVGLGFAITGSLDYTHCDAPCTLDTTKLALAGVRLGQVGIVALAVLTVTAEYSTRTIQPTLMAVPRRVLVVLGKLGVLTVVGVATGILAVAGCLAAARAILPRNGFTAAHGYPALSLSDDLTRRAAIGTVLYIGLVALLAAGLGLLLRDTAGAVTAALALLYGSPVVAMFVNDPKWQHRIHRFSPMDAGLVIQSTRNLAAEHVGPWAGLGVLSSYAAVAVLAGLVVFHLRDAR